MKKEIKLPRDRIGAFVGKNGSTKNDIENKFGVKLNVNSATGLISVIDINSDYQFFKLTHFINAVGSGFSPERAFRLISDDEILLKLDLKEYSGKSINSLNRIKGRIIGLNGKTRTIIEDMTNTYVSIYRHHVSILGEYNETKIALESIKLLASGSPHKVVYSLLENYRSKLKTNKVLLWEENKIIE